MFQYLKSVAIDYIRRARIYVNNHGYDCHPLDQRCWEDQIVLLGGRNDIVIFDIGANCGQIATQYRKMFPNARLFCFEPEEQSFADLQNQLRKDPEVSCHMVAVGASPGKARFHITASRDSSSLLFSDCGNLPPGWRKNLAVERESMVEVITLDDFAKQHGIDSIDICKIDIQGGECAALEGACRLLSAAKISLIYLEVAFVPMYVGHPLLGDVAKSLARHEYTFHMLYNLVINGRTGRLLQGDAIFVSPKLYDTSREQLKKNWGGSA